MTIDDTWGAMIVAVFVSAALFGVLTVQVHLYFTRFQDDPRWMKALVGTVWTIDLIHQAVASQILYDYLITHFGVADALHLNSWAVCTVTLLEPWSSVLVQGYFARRLYILNPKAWPITVLTACLSIMSWAAGESTAITIFQLTHFHQFEEHTLPLLVWLISCALCDIMVTVPVAYTLYTSRTGFKKTDRLLTKLMVWTINTGALPLAFALLEIITFVTLNQTLLHLGANVLLAKLYSNTLLAFLNRRGRSLYGESEDNNEMMWSRQSRGGGVIRGATTTHTSIQLGADVELGHISPTDGVRIAVSTMNFVDDDSVRRMGGTDDSKDYYDRKPSVAFVQ